MIFTFISSSYFCRRWLSIFRVSIFMLYIIDSTLQIFSLLSSSLIVFSCSCMPWYLESCCSKLLSLSFREAILLVNCSIWSSSEVNSLSFLVFYVFCPRIFDADLWFLSVKSDSASFVEHLFVVVGSMLLLFMLVMDELAAEGEAEVDLVLPLLIFSESSSFKRQKL
jgi:hypothetical protein